MNSKLKIDKFHWFVSLKKFIKQNFQPKKLISLLLAFAILIGFYYASLVFINYFGRERLAAVIDSFGWLGWLVLVLIIIALNVAAPISSVSIVFGISVQFYGLFFGGILSLIGSVLGSSLNFYLARKFGIDIWQKLFGKKALLELQEMVAKIGHKVDIVLFGLCFFIADLAGYAAGFTKIRYREYLLVLIVAQFLAIAFYSLGFNQLSRLFGF